MASSYGHHLRSGVLIFEQNSLFECKFFCFIFGKISDLDRSVELAQTSLQQVY